MRRMALGTRNTPAVTRKAVTMRRRVWNLLGLLAISQMATTKKMTDGIEQDRLERIDPGAVHIVLRFMLHGGLLGIADVILIPGRARRTTQIGRDAPGRAEIITMAGFCRGGFTQRVRCIDRYFGPA